MSLTTDGSILHEITSILKNWKEIPNPEKQVLAFTLPQGVHLVSAQKTKLKNILYTNIPLKHTSPTK
jgi:hypothetical protein